MKIEIAKKDLKTLVDIIERVISNYEYWRPPAPSNKHAMVSRKFYKKIALLQLKYFGNEYNIRKDYFPKTKRETMMRTFQYTCVAPNNKSELNKIVDNSKRISRQTFCRNVDRKNRLRVEKGIGYGRHMPMAQDYHVSYFKTRLKNKTVYFFSWSGIDYIFY